MNLFNFALAFRRCRHSSAEVRTPPRPPRRATPRVEALENIISLSPGGQTTQVAVASQANAEVVTYDASNTKGKLVINGVFNVVQYNLAQIDQSAGTSGTGGSATQLGGVSQTNSAVEIIDVSNHKGKVVIKDSANITQINIAQVDQSVGTDGTNGSVTQDVDITQCNAATVAIVGVSSCKGKVVINGSAAIYQYNNADVNQVAAATGASTSITQLAAIAQSDGAKVIIDVSNCKGTVVIRGSCNIYQYNDANVSQVAAAT